MNVYGVVPLIIGLLCVSSGVHSLMVSPPVNVMTSNLPYCSANWFDNSLTIMFLEDNMCIMFNDKIYMDVIRRVEGKWKIFGDNHYVEICINPVYVRVDNILTLQENYNYLLINIYNLDSVSYPVTWHKSALDVKAKYYKSVYYLSFCDIGSILIMETVGIDKKSVAQVTIPIGVILLIVGIVVLRSGMYA